MHQNEILDGLGRSSVTTQSRCVVSEDHQNQILDGLETFQDHT